MSTSSAATMPCTGSGANTSLLITATTSPCPPCSIPISPCENLKLAPPCLPGLDVLADVDEVYVNVETATWPDALCTLKLNRRYGVLNKIGQRILVVGEHIPDSCFSCSVNRDMNLGVYDGQGVKVLGVERKSSWMRSKITIVSPPTGTKLGQVIEKGYFCCGANENITDGTDKVVMKTEYKGLSWWKVNIIDAVTGKEVIHDFFIHDKPGGKGIRFPTGMNSATKAVLLGFLLYRVIDEYDTQGCTCMTAAIIYFLLSLCVVMFITGVILISAYNVV